MSKLTKLFRHPKQFVVDSKYYRRYLLLANRGRMRALRPTISLSPHGRLDHLGQDLVEDLATSVPLIDLSGPGSFVIATTRSNAHLLSEYLQELGRAEIGFRLFVESKNRRLPLEDASLFAIDDALSRDKVASLHIADSELGVGVTIEIEFWKEEENQLTGPRRNMLARRISYHTVEQLGLLQPGKYVHASALYAQPLVHQVQFSVDIVYTWVNHRDPRWKELRRSVRDQFPFEEKKDSGSLDRFLNRDELKYSLRSVATYAPWVRRIHIVSNCSPPSWLNLDHEKISWVDHPEIFPPDALPTFNSHAIESRLQHVPGLAEHFVYFNDDFFLLRPCSADDFFFSNGISKSFMEEYSTVNGEVQSVDPDYLNAARNGQALLEETFGRSASMLHKHTPYALRRDVLLEMEERYASWIGPTTRHAFRTIEDISTVSFLYHHYAYLTGRAVYCSRDAVLLKPYTPLYERKMVQLLQRQRPPLSLCLNDGGGSSDVPHWDRHVVEYLEAWFPRPCEYEVASEQAIIDRSSKRNVS